MTATPPDSSEDKREYFRLTVNLPMAYQLEGETVSSAPTPMSLNLSGGGVGFVAERKFNLDDMLLLKILLPSQPPIFARAKIVRTAQLGKNTASYSIGAQFTGLDGKDKEQILKYLINVQLERRRERYTT
ncbi:MAG: PilZ domain-containing protein [Nitrospirae bacterium]|nr:MAG: PilZ domain-containing protein [Nitrospirota bacterium]